MLSDDRPDQSLAAGAGRETGRRPTQAERRARSRAAVLESAARGLSRYGYANLVLEDVAREAGYTRGAVYHQFKDKEDLALAVLHWVEETSRASRCHSELSSAARTIESPASWSASKPNWSSAWLG